MLSGIDIGSDVLRYVAMIKVHARDILFKIPGIHTVPKYMGDIPDHAVQFRTFLFLFAFCHGLFLLCC